MPVSYLYLDYYFLLIHLWNVPKQILIFLFLHGHQKHQKYIQFHPNLFYQLLLNKNPDLFLTPAFFIFCWMIAACSGVVSKLKWTVWFCISLMCIFLSESNKLRCIVSLLLFGSGLFFTAASGKKPCLAHCRSFRRSLPKRKIFAVWTDLETWPRLSRYASLVMPTTNDGNGSALSSWLIAYHDSHCSSLSETWGIEVAST